MVAHHIHDALAQVRRMQELILEKKSFRGYSGRARMIGAVVTLAGAIIMGGRHFPGSNIAHLIGWAIVLSAALVLNYGALFVWFLFNPRVKRNAAMLVPAVDALPALGVGALMSTAFVLKGNYNFLFGTWMSLYGLAHVSYRQSLPQANYAVGAFYMLCGVVCLVWPGLSFTNPWPMGIVFFAGEMMGGYILYRNNCIREMEDRRMLEAEARDNDNSKSI